MIKSTIRLGIFVVFGNARSRVAWNCGGLSPDPQIHCLMS